MTTGIVHLGKRPAARIQLFCFPYAGVGTSAYAGWAESLPSWIQPLCFQPPGREFRFREAPFTCMDDLTASLLPALAAAIEGSYAFYGHSMGALVAHETACKLVESGYPAPEHLFVGASRAPQLAWPHPPIRHLPDLEFLEQVNLRYGAVPEQILADAEIRSLFATPLRGDFSIVETYQCQHVAPLACPISAFAGDQDHMVTAESVQAWNERTSGPFKAREIRGPHLFLRTESKQLQDVILEELGRQ